jgi:hypothetical protein
MAEGVDSAAAIFQQAIDPAQTANEQPAQRQPATRARDDAGRFAQVAERPEPLFSVRMLEGDPETGDTSDGGDNARLRQREREIADGRFDERANREAQSRARQAPAEGEGESGERRLSESDSERSDAAADDGHTGADDEPEGEDAEAAGDEAGDDDLENAQFEITVDGAPQTVSLGELRDGYIRTATFHSRLNKVNEHKAAVEQENQRVGQLRDLYINGLTALDYDISQMVPAEPDWDAEFARDPQAAHQKQKQFQAYFNKLNQIRGYRAWAQQNQREEHDRASAKYAVDQFSQFVDDHQKVIKDEASLRRVIGGMRKTALAEGFQEHEVAGVYDKRMLNVLFKAWLYDQGMAVRPQAALPGPGKSLAPGSARPLNGSAGRRNVDEAQRQLARTGKMEDATNYFQRLLR